MEPNTQPTAPMGATNKNKKMLIVTIIIILVILATFLLKSKVSAPIDVNSGNSNLQGDNKILSSELDSATSFDNEADLKEIDKVF